MKYFGKYLEKGGNEGSLIFWHGSGHTALAQTISMMGEPNDKDDNTQDYYDSISYSR